MRKILKRRSRNRNSYRQCLTVYLWMESTPSRAHSRFAKSLSRSFLVISRSESKWKYHRRKSCYWFSTICSRV